MAQVGISRTFIHVLSHTHYALHVAYKFTRHIGILLANQHKYTVPSVAQYYWILRYNERNGTERGFIMQQLPCSIHLEVCQQVVGYTTGWPSYTTGNKRYIVKTGPKPYCTCHSFQHQHGTDADGLCKHIRDAMQHACRWTELSPIRQTIPLRCPMCGSRTQGVAW